MQNSCYRWIGTAAARIRFNETKLVEVNGERYWAKKRLPCSAVLVGMANAYAQATGLPMRMLGERTWLDYEPLLFRELLNRAPVLRQGKTLLLPHMAGERLSIVLAGGGAVRKQRAIKLAARELGQMHGRQVEHPLRGGLQWFSHADATPGNVMVDLEQGQATWLDFETVHPAGMPALARHADDLRTLLGGMAGIVSVSELPSLAEAALEAYPDATVLQALCGTFDYWDRRPAVGLLAMPTPGAERWQCLVKAVNSLVITRRS